MVALPSRGRLPRLPRSRGRPRLACCTLYPRLPRSRGLDEADRHPRGLADVTDTRTGVARGEVEDLDGSAAALPRRTTASARAREEGVLKLLDGRL